MRSMTGFGSGESDSPAGALSCEVRSFNHRNLKVSMRLPSILSGAEPDLESRIRRVLDRGAVHVSLRLEPGAQSRSPVIDRQRAAAYAGALADLARELGIPGEPDLAMIAAMPGVVMPAGDADHDPDEMARTARKALDDALKDLVKSRDREGTVLEKDLTRRIGTITRALRRVEKRAPKMAEAARKRLERRLQDVLKNLPAEAAGDAVSREVVLMAERSDIAEEVTRLHAHLDAFREAMAGSGPVGRRLDFVLQEMLREVNTIGSKSQDATIGAAVVDMKVEVDRLKEQAANIE